jgi:hypothetical protein
MRDEKDEILDDLFRKARLMKPFTESVEEHFETRLLAAMEEKRRDQTLWSVWTWRLVPWFAVIVFIVGIGNLTIDPDRSGDLFSTFAGGDDDYQVTSMLAGG